ncbi:hypothetical protein CEXT_568021 [Caerostris extrusa]|uniref:Uncharacterized protein n=1 Tax=Caerostris extrusa TaxID=172846 RepID=A0AAV4PWU6_CAEEX|nr:hypothetical protein CEXT_568021 [Caerostris extrusa]
MEVFQIPIKRPVPIGSLFLFLFERMRLEGVEGWVVHSILLTFRAESKIKDQSRDTDNAFETPIFDDNNELPQGNHRTNASRKASGLKCFRTENHSFTLYKFKMSFVISLRMDLLAIKSRDADFK